jgi:uncharacterized protein (TIGR02466 family)
MVALCATLSQGTERSRVIFKTAATEVPMTTGQMAEPGLQQTNEQPQGFNCYFTPFWVCDNPAAQAIKPGLMELVEQVQAHEKGTSDTNRSNRGGWRSNTLALRQAGLYPLVPWLTKMVGQVVVTKHRYRIDPWLNVHYQHGFNVRHTHPGAVLSGVYYISVPEGSGNLVIEDPRADAVFSRFDRFFKYCENDHLSHGVIKISPKEGRLVMFPAWLPHHVETSDSIEARISLPFNLVYKETPASNRTAPNRLSAR